ncbi:MAG: PBP1A family penicillin-binding protein [Planifilum fulgidum]
MRQLQLMWKLWRKSMGKKWWFLVLTTSLLLIAGGCSAVFLTGGVYDLESMKKMNFASTLYDRQNKKVVQLGDTHFEYVKLEDIKSDLLIQTFVAVEDRRFYKHNGVDWKSIGRATVRNLLAMGAVEGGGTITMQVARNAILQDRDKELSRKIKESLIAWNLERRYTKDEILEAYLNYIYLGNQVRGVKMAAKIYFDKDITKEELEPHEIALLAGLPKAPGSYNPYLHPKKAKDRRDTILDVMEETGLISKAENKKYQKKGLGVNRKYLSKYKKNNQYAAYVDMVIDEAAERYGMDEQELTSGAYKIYTGLIPSAQKTLENTLKNDPLLKAHSGLDAGATIIDPKNGEIVAVGGGRNYLSGYLNRALLPKQPGSSIKPISVYAPAVEEKGYTEYTRVLDAPITVNGWSPQNYSRTYSGWVPLRTVAAKSLNAATVRLLHEVVGVKTGAEYAKKMGLPIKKEDRYLAPLALGGLTEGVNTVQMAGAYSAFANDGKIIEPHTIRKIEAWDGDEVKPKKEPEQRKVFSPQTARIMTKILKFVVEGGTGQNARIPGWEVAGKTGTTQNYKEAWFVGYTPRYVMATMVYNDKGSRVQLSGGDYPARIFHKVMSEIHAGLKPKSFEGPTKKGPSIPESDGPSWNPGPEKPHTPGPGTQPPDSRPQPNPGRGNNGGDNTSPPPHPGGNNGEGGGNPGGGGNGGGETGGGNPGGGGNGGGETGGGNPGGGGNGGGNTGGGGGNGIGEN